MQKIAQLNHECTTIGMAVSHNRMWIDFVVHADQLNEDDLSIGIFGKMFDPAVVDLA